MGCAPGSNIHEDAVDKLCMLIESGIYQAPLGLSQGNHIGIAGLELFSCLTKVLRQTMDFNLMAQQIVKEEIGDALVFRIAKNDIALSTLSDSTLEELLLMTQEHGLLIGASLQSTYSTAGMVAQILGKLVDTNRRLHLYAL